MLIPPRPEPLARTRLGVLGFLRVAHSWIDALTEKSYHMLLGHFRLPALRVFIVNDPAWVERILVQEPERYPKHRLMHEALEPLLGTSPFTTNGAQWQRQRRMLDQAFGHARLGLVFPLMQQACDDMLARLAPPDDAPATVDMHEAMTHVTADIIFRTIFSERLPDAQAQALFGAFARYQTLSQRAMVLRLFGLPMFGLGRARARQAERIRGVLAARVRERFATRTDAQERDGADFLAGLRAARDPDDGSALTETEVLDQICMLFLAGHETSASALGWCMYLLGESADLQAALRAEVEAAAPGRALAPQDMRRLGGLAAMFREVLRLYPPVGYFPREALEDQEIRGVPVRKGSALLVFPWLLHRHRRWWTDPDAFLPGRFAADRETRPVRGSYLPFGLGARACLGAGFAMQEAALIMASLLRHHEILPVPASPPKVIGRLTVRSDRGILVRLRRRPAHPAPAAEAGPPPDAPACPAMPRPAGTCPIHAHATLP